MKKIFLVLLACFILGSCAFAAVASDYYSTNVGAQNGKFVKTTVPVTKQVILNGWESSPAASQISSGEAIMGLVISSSTATQESYIYIIAKPKAGGIIYRTIALDTVATDEYTAQ